MKSILLFSSLFVLLFFKAENNYVVSLGKVPDSNGFNFCNVSISSAESRKENEVLATIDVLDEKHIQFNFIKRSVNDKLFF